MKRKKRVVPDARSEEQKEEEKEQQQQHEEQQQVEDDNNTPRKKSRKSDGGGGALPPNQESAEKQIDGTRTTVRASRPRAPTSSASAPSAVRRDQPPVSWKKRKLAVLAATSTSAAPEVKGKAEASEGGDAHNMHGGDEEQVQEAGPETPPQRQTSPPQLKEKGEKEEGQEKEYPPSAATRHTGTEDEGEGHDSEKELDTSASHCEEDGRKTTTSVRDEGDKRKGNRKANAPKKVSFPPCTLVWASEGASDPFYPGVVFEPSMLAQKFLKGCKLRSPHDRIIYWAGFHQVSVARTTNMRLLILDEIKDREHTRKVLQASVKGKKVKIHWEGLDYLEEHYSRLSHEEQLAWMKAYPDNKNMSSEEDQEDEREEEDQEDESEEDESEEDESEEEEEEESGDEKLKGKKVAQKQRPEREEEEISQQHTKKRVKERSNLKQGKGVIEKPARQKAGGKVQQTSSSQTRTDSHVRQEKRKSLTPHLGEKAGGTSKTSSSAQLSLKEIKDVLKSTPEEREKVLEDLASRDTPSIEELKEVGLAQDLKNLLKDKNCSGKVKSLAKAIRSKWRTDHNVTGGGAGAAIGPLTHSATVAEPLDPSSNRRDTSSSSAATARASSHVQGVRSEPPRSSSAPAVPSLDILAMEEQVQERHNELSNTIDDVRNDVVRLRARELLRDGMKGNDNMAHAIESAIFRHYGGSDNPYRRRTSTVWMLLNEEKDDRGGPGVGRALRYKILNHQITPEMVAKSSTLELRDLAEGLP